MHKIKSFCQFCMRIQTEESKLLPITRKIKQDFYNLTRKKLNTSIYCEFICCEPCLEELESAIVYRTKLLANQNALLSLNTQTEIECEILPKNNETVEEIEYIDEEYIIEEEEEEFFLIKEELESITDATGTNLNASGGLTTSQRKKYPRKRLQDPVKCPKCDKLFYYKNYLAFHYKDVHQEQCEVCQYCGKTFKNNRRLNSHILIHRVGEKRFKCEHCGKEFNYSGDFVRHKRIHEQIKPYQCHFEGCGKSFIQSYALKLHLDVHNNVKFKCDRCASEFSVKSTLKNHMTKCIEGAPPTRKSRSQSKKDSSSTSSRDRYKCFVDDCDREFSSRKYLGVHLEKHHELKLANFQTTCLECQQVFDNYGDYSKHVKIHTCLFVCDFCKVRFKTKEKLQAHIDKLHKEGDDAFRTYACEDCGARFKRLEHLKGHQLYKHSDEKNFSCSLCPLKFRQRGEFNVHMRVHQNIKPFSCWKCNHLCKTSSNLRQHMKIVHNETNIYCCDICQESFKYNVELSDHKKEHANSTIYEIVEINDVS